MSKTVYFDYIGKLAFEFINFIRKLNGETEFEKWEDLSIERKQFIYHNINDVIVDRNITGRDLHNKWAELRIEKGWKHGEVTDRENKIHACLVPFDDLNFFQKLKDDIFVQVIKSSIDHEYEPTDKQVLDKMKGFATFRHGYKLVGIKEIGRKQEFFDLVAKYIDESMHDFKYILFRPNGVPMRVFCYEDIEISNINAIIETDLAEKLDIK